MENSQKNNSYLWLYNNNTIIEYGITLNPWSISFIRNISTSSFIGKGLTTYDQNTLISADNWVRKIDITPPLVNANITLMFQLPSWCLGDIIWDSDKPDGTPRKLMDVTRLHSMGWKHSHDLEDGIINLYHWFLKNYSKIRG